MCSSIKQGATQHTDWKVEEGSHVSPNQCPSSNNSGCLSAQPHDMMLWQHTHTSSTHSQRQQWPTHLAGRGPVLNGGWRQPADSRCRNRHEHLCNRHPGRCHLASDRHTCARNRLLQGMVQGHGPSYKLPRAAYYARFLAEPLKLSNTQMTRTSTKTFQHSACLLKPQSAPTKQAPTCESPRKQKACAVGSLPQRQVCTRRHKMLNARQSETTPPPRA